MNIVINNRQRAARVQRSALRRLAAWLLEQALSGAPRRRAAAPRAFRELEILLTDDAGMALVNQAVFGRSAITDVISQAYQPVPGEDGARAELALNVALARREGARRAGGAGRELALYLAHGCDHLGGAQDATAAGRAAMRRREQRWLAAAQQAGLLSGLLAPGDS